MRAIKVHSPMAFSMRSAKRLPEAVGVETMPMIAKLAAYAKATEERKASETGPAGPAEQTAQAAQAVQAAQAARGGAAS